MNSQTYLKGCQNPSRWHSFRMQSRTSPSSALLRHLMNIPPQPLEQGEAHTSPTDPITIFSLMLVLGTMQPILPLPLRERMYMLLLVPKNLVDDKSVKVGGTQCIATLDGYAFP